MSEVVKGYAMQRTHVCVNSTFNFTTAVPQNRDRKESIAFWSAFS